MFIHGQVGHWVTPLFVSMRNSHVAHLHLDQLRTAVISVYIHSMVGFELFISRGITNIRYSLFFCRSPCVSFIYFYLQLIPVIIRTYNTNKVLIQLLLHCRQYAQRDQLRPAVSVSCHTLTCNPYEIVMKPTKREYMKWRVPRTCV